MITAIILHASLWCIKWKHDSTGTRRDLSWIVLFILWFSKTTLYRQFLPLASFFGAIAFILIFCLGFFWIRPVPKIQQDPQDGNRKNQVPFATPILKPLVFPCRTSHTRIFPKKHSFSYSYLFVGIPIGWQGFAANSLLADCSNAGGDGNSFWQKPWFSVDAADHLNRGDHSLGLKRKLHDYLESQVRKPPFLLKIVNCKKS